ncbi:MAG: magnesium transporter [Halobacteriales archaeon]
MPWTVRGITRTLLPVLLVLTVIELGSGLVLGSFESTLLTYPSVLVLVPVTIGTAGNLGSILAARLSTAFHLGLLEFSPADDRLGGNAMATVLLATTLFPIVGASAWGLSALTGNARLGVATVMLIATASGIVLSVLAVIVTVIATYAAYRLSVDPDDVVIPVVTNTCDVLGVLVLFLVVAVVL